MKLHHDHMRRHGYRNGNNETHANTISSNRDRDTKSPAPTWWRAPMRGQLLGLDGTNGKQQRWRRCTFAPAAVLVGSLPGQNKCVLAHSVHAQKPAPATGLSSSSSKAAPQTMLRTQLACPCLVSLRVKSKGFAGNAGKQSAALLNRRQQQRTKKSR